MMLSKTPTITAQEKANAIIVSRAESNKLTPTSITFGKASLFPIHVQTQSGPPHATVLISLDMSQNKVKRSGSTARIGPSI